MKKIKMIFITTVIFALSIFAVSAAEADVVVSLQIDNPIMEVNGGQAEIDPGRGTSPVVINNRTLVPIRAIIEAFGGSVTWQDSTQTVVLAMGSDTVSLVIDSEVAYFNSELHTLDAAPQIINERTMLPIRFVAESFNLGVAWDGSTQTVYVISNTLDDSEYSYITGSVPEYSGKPYVQINNNMPLFKDYEIINGSFEYYSTLDELGRCDVCMASVAEDIMPTEERSSISSVTPTGWINNSYDSVDGGYLYNRCHLIGFQLTGENANERNLITGTRYLNVDAMLPFENMVDDYIEQTGNRVMYRVTPVFENENLVADGVLMEAYSVEDNGSGISFCVYCYNVQPGIYIDYATGANSDMYTDVAVVESPYETAIQSGIYRTPTGKKYHYSSSCNGGTYIASTLEKALARGLTPCKKCVG